MSTSINHSRSTPSANIPSKNKKLGMSLNEKSHSSIGGER